MKLFKKIICKIWDIFNLPRFSQMPLKVKVMKNIEMNKEQGVSRKFIGIKLSKDYFDIATKRIENYFTGKEK